MLERDFKRKEQEKLKEKGWVIIQFVAGPGVPKCFPDTILLAPNGYHCLIEWKKSEDAKKQPLQPYWNAKLNGMKHDTFFAEPENIQEILSKILKKGSL